MPLKNALALLFNAEKGVSTPSSRLISRGGTRGRARGMPAGDGSLRATGMRERVSARGNRREAPARPAPSKPRGLQGPLRPAAPGRPHLEFVGARGAASAAPASPLNAVDARVVDTLPLQHREAHPFHPRPGPSPAKPVPLRAEGVKRRRGPLGPHEVWHARQPVRTRRSPGTPASPPGGERQRGTEKRAIGLLLFLLHLDRLKPSRGAGAPLARFCFRLFRSLFTERQQRGAGRAFRAARTMVMHARRGTGVRGPP